MAAVGTKGDKAPNTRLIRGNSGGRTRIIPEGERRSKRKQSIFSSKKEKRKKTTPCVKKKRISALGNKRDVSCILGRKSG